MIRVSFWKDLWAQRKFFEIVQPSHAIDKKYKVFQNYEIHGGWLFGQLGLEDILAMQRYPQLHSTSRFS